LQGRIRLRISQLIVQDELTDALSQVEAVPLLRTHLKVQKSEFPQLLLPRQFILLSHHALRKLLGPLQSLTVKIIASLFDLPALLQYLLLKVVPQFLED
jgi:hypothetical protein